MAIFSSHRVSEYSEASTRLTRHDHSLAMISLSTCSHRVLGKYFSPKQVEPFPLHRSPFVSPREPCRTFRVVSRYTLKDFAASSLWNFAFFPPESVTMLCIGMGMVMPESVRSWVERSWLQWEYQERVAAHYERGCE
jgi:hypothetical protein